MSRGVSIFNYPEKHSLKHRTRVRGHIAELMSMTKIVIVLPDAHTPTGCPVGKTIWSFTNQTVITLLLFIIIVFLFYKSRPLYRLGCFTKQIISFFNMGSTILEQT